MLIEDRVNILHSACCAKLTVHVFEQFHVNCKCPTKELLHPFLLWLSPFFRVRLNSWHCRAALCDVTKCTESSPKLMRTPSASSSLFQTCGRKTKHQF